MKRKNDHSDREFTTEETVLVERLRSFRVPAMVEEYMRQLQDPNAGLLSFQDRFTKIVNAEWIKRYNKKFNDKLKKAKLRFIIWTNPATANSPHTAMAPYPMKSVI